MNFEWATMAYTLFTLLLIFFTYTKLQHPEALIAGRMRIVAMTVALWAVYRLVPCRLTIFIRVVAQLALLAWWYPDTYELNRVLPNLDHLFATWEQQLLGCQPALLFSQFMPQAWFSELMNLGYASYYPLIVAVLIYYFGWRYQEFERATFVLLGSFFAYYVIFDLLPLGQGRWRHSRTEDLLQAAGQRSHNKRRKSRAERMWHARIPDSASRSSRSTLLR